MNENPEFCTRNNRIINKQKQMKNLIFLNLILISLLAVAFTSCEKEKVIQKETEVLVLKSNCEPEKKAVLGQNVVFSVSFNNEDVTSDPSTSFYVNGKAIKGNHFEVTEEVALKVYAIYKKTHSNELQIEVVKEEVKEEKQIYLELNVDPKDIPAGKTVTFTVKNDKGETLTDDVKLFLEGLEFVGNTYTFSNAGMFSVYAQYQNLKSEVVKCTVKEVVASQTPDEKNTIKVIRNYYDDDLLPISNEAKSLKVELYGFADDDEKEVNVYSYNVDGKDIKCTRWNIDFENLGIGCQTAISIMVPLENGKLVTPDKAKKIYVYSLNIISSENHSLTLSSMNPEDKKVLEKMDITFDELNIGNLKNDFLAELNISFKGNIRATMHDNFMRKDLDTMINFICNPSAEHKRLNSFRIQNDTMGVKETISINSLKDIFK